MKRVFKASQFVDMVGGQSATRKATFANWLVDFIAAGFPKSRFSAASYRRLSSTFGHIACYDRDGFWETWFETPKDRRRFVEQLLQFRVYGDPEYTYSDVERAVQGYFLERPELVLKGIRAASRGVERERRVSDV